MAVDATYYLDACVFIDYIELPPTDPVSAIIDSIIEGAEKGRFRLVTSTITIAEVLWAKEEADRAALSLDIEAKIGQLFHPGSSPIELIPVHEIIAREAQRLLRDNLHQGWKKTKGMDAIHLITAKREKVDEFFTNEQAMTKWGQLLGFKCVSPHFTPPVPRDEGQTQLFEVS